MLVLNIQCGKPETRSIIFNDKLARGAINTWNTKRSSPPCRCVNSRGCGTFISMPRPITCQRRLSLLLSFQTLPALVRTLTGHRQHFHPFRVVFSSQQLSTCLLHSGRISGNVEQLSRLNVDANQADALSEWNERSSKKLKAGPLLFL